MGNQNFIVINGKKYDAVTGVLLKNEQPAQQSSHSTNTQSNRTTAPSGVVDGFVRTSKPRKAHPPAHHLSKQAQHSSTLARRAVKKPAAAALNQTEPSRPSIVKQRLGTSPRRASIAQQTPKSPHIQKYGNSQIRSSVVKKHVERPVQQAPGQAQNNHPQSDTRQQHVSPKPAHRDPRTQTERIIENAMATAASHQEVFDAPKKKHSRLSKKLGISRRALSLSSGVLAAVMLFGFFAFQNIPNLSMKVASTRAGFDAQLPGYKPSGFSFTGPIQYQPGVVTVSFKSNTDTRSYSLIQHKSNWNSDALLADYVLAEGKQYQTYLDKGRTLYIYDGSNATWVDDGIWYQVEGDSGLTTDQLIRIASSI